MGRERKRGEGKRKVVKGKVEGERRCREGYGPPKNFDVAASMMQMQMQDVIKAL